MSKIIKPKAGIIFMKVGTHAQETLNQIISRKMKEIDEAGYAMWGYGGTTCHPRTMVQPFARSFVQRGEVIYLCMEEMESKHYAQQVRAEQFSIDGLEWEEIPSAINVLGSRYALKIKGLRKDAFELPLAQTQVAIGTNKGKAGDLYIKGRVDKACLEVADFDNNNSVTSDQQQIQIGLVAELVEPYAVFLRNRP